MYLPIEVTLNEASSVAFRIWNSASVRVFYIICTRWIRNLSKETCKLLLDGWHFNNNKQAAKTMC